MEPEGDSFAVYWLLTQSRWKATQVYASVCVGASREVEWVATLDEIAYLLYIYKPSKCHVNNTALIYMNGKHYTNMVVNFILMQMCSKSVNIICD